MWKRFSHVMLWVTDLDRAVRFYTETLGFVPNFVVPGKYGSLRHEEMGCRLDLHPTDEAANIGHGALPYFTVENIDEAVAELKSAGVRTGEIMQEEGSPRFSHFWDSEGNGLGLEEAWNPQAFRGGVHG